MVSSYKCVRNHRKTVIKFQYILSIPVFLVRCDIVRNNIGLKLIFFLSISFISKCCHTEAYEK